MDEDRKYIVINNEALMIQQDLFEYINGCLMIMELLRYKRKSFEI